MKVAGILQSRMTSTRLPGKAMAPIAGRPLTEWIVDRASRCRRLDEIILAVPTESENDPLARHFDSRCTVYRGSLHDVLDRYWNAASASKADVIVRIVGDNPLLDPPIMDAAVEGFLEQNVDYGNTPECPLGVGAEVFTFQALDRAHREAAESYQREHVTPYFYEQPGRFRMGSMDVADLLYGIPKDGARLTVDTPDDLGVIEEIFSRLMPVSPHFGMKEISELRRTHPEMFERNLQVRQKSFRESEIKK